MKRRAFLAPLSPLTWLAPVRAALLSGSPVNRRTPGAFGGGVMTRGGRIESGFRCVREVVAKVWPHLLVGIDLSGGEVFTLLRVIRPGLIAGFAGAATASIRPVGYVFNIVP